MTQLQSVSISLQTNGFLGHAYCPHAEVRRAVIVVTGSDGGLDNARYIAKQLAKQGCLAVAVGYFQADGLSPILSEIPLAYIAQAIAWVKAFGNGQIRSIAGYGYSKGAEYMLLAASTFHEIDTVVALVPNDFVCEGIQRRIPLYTGKSSWTYHGTPLPYTPLRFPLGTFLKRSIMTRQLYMAAAYERAFAQGVRPDSWIPIERASARILLLSVTEDTIWPSQRACVRLMQRLRAARYPHDIRHVTFVRGSHLLIPMLPEKAKTLGRVIRAERDDPAGCEGARMEALALSTAWLMESPCSVATRSP